MAMKKKIVPNSKQNFYIKKLRKLRKDVLLSKNQDFKLNDEFEELLNELNPIIDRCGEDLKSFFYFCKREYVLNKNVENELELKPKGRYALCFHGLIGSSDSKSMEGSNNAEDVLRISALHWNKYIIQPNLCDIFIHCWNTDFEEKIEELYHPKMMVVESQKEFYQKRGRGEEAGHSMWYSVWKSNSLKKEYELQNNFKYDAVMSVRFDAILKQPICFDNVNYKNKIYHGNDYFFLADNHNMDNFADLYLNLKEYSKITKFSNHRLFYKHCDELNLNRDETLIKTFSAKLFYLNRGRMALGHSERFSDLSLVRDEYYGYIFVIQ